MAADTLSMPAYAKVNLSLEVIGRRDDGYHEVATILQTVDLADTVTLRPADGLTVTCDDATPIRGGQHRLGRRRCPGKARGRRSECPHHD